MKALKHPIQCEKCPWKVGVNPFEIPNGYSRQKHGDLADTIADSESLDLGSPLRVMACHESNAEPCIGWLNNQLGPGNNISLRLAVRHCENIGLMQVIGEQYTCFEETLPNA